MKTKIIPLILGCCMIVNTGCHKEAGLPNGVYVCEFSGIVSDRSSSWAREPFDICWTLMVMDDETLFQINGKPFDRKVFVYGYCGAYYLKPERQPDGSLTAEMHTRQSDYVRYNYDPSIDIKLVFKEMSQSGVDVEIVEGMISEMFSGGGYYLKPTPLIPETQTLTFVRELSDEDKKELMRVKSETEENEL